MPSLKQLFSLCLLGGGGALSAFSTWLVWIVWKGGWSVSNQSQQLEILGWALLGGLSGVMVSLIAIAVGGVRSRVKPAQ
jgi:hypothetical protein